ncbi:hypothetical protein QFZ75_000043 [Streptomyces sp. V3I8]|uniref:hypothetical protein n=1 Tax=Streptomyces sp. V3I8 TaxID=3042279 RepID=UPI00277E932E|nr:hypothetical protein [Streptomyces sp. V3I8]MDQ1033627.1 hypothetical protein [Streptomyces sp. V3I8]
MTHTLNTPACPYEPDSPLAHLMEIAAAAVGEASEDEERDAAETTAAHLIFNTYTYTLEQAVDPDIWHGYPSVRERGTRRLESAAVASLGGGLWLHHTLRISESDGASDVLTLIAPCTCGRGYTDIVLDTEEHLIDILAELRPTHGRSPHDPLTPDCHSIQPVPALSGWPRGARSID